MGAAPTSPDPRADEAAWSQFRRYWFGHVSSFSGDWFTLLALPIAALSISDSPLLIGVVEFAEIAATLLIGMRLGGLADRWPPRATMIAADVVRAALVGLVALTFLLDAPHAALLVLVAFSLGAMRDLHDGAESVMMSAVVPEPMLVRANSWFQISDGLGHMLGSLLAGVAASLSVSLALGLDAVSYVIAAIAVVAMGRFHVARDGAPDEPAAAPWRAAWRVARREDRYWRVVVTMCVTNVATVCFMGQFVTFATQELGLSNWQIGLTLSAMGLGSFVAGLALDRIGTISPRAIVVAPLVIGASPVASALTGSWAVTAASFVLVGGALAFGGALVGAMRHASFESAVQGRVALASRLGFTSGVLPGVLIAGWLSDSVGVTTMYVVFGSIGLAGAVVGVALGVTRISELAPPDGAPEDRPIGADDPERGGDEDVAVVVDLRDPVRASHPAPMSEDAVRAVLAEALRQTERRW